MNHEDIYKLLGRASTDPEVVSLLVRAGCTIKPKCKKSDPDFDWVSKEHCVDLMFKDEDYLTGNEDRDRYGIAPLIFNMVNIEPKGSRVSYPNSLIQLQEGIDFGISRALVLKTLGKPFRTFELRGIINADQWQMPDLGKFIVAYQSGESLKRIQLATTKFDK